MNGEAVKIESVAITNFRCFSSVTIHFDDYACLVGPNGSGKSTILSALNLFFRQSEDSGADTTDLGADDCHHKDTAHPIEITVTFTDLEEEAQRDFADYYRGGKLVISTSAQFDESTGKAAVTQFGQRRGMTMFSGFFRALGDSERVDTLTELYQAIRQQLPELPLPSTKVKMIAALRKYESEHDDVCELIPSQDEFYGFSKGANRLGKYVQWVFVPAVKDATTEQLEARNTALSRLLARTVRSQINFREAIASLRIAALEGYDVLLADSQGTLAQLSESLQRRLEDWAHPDATLRLEWNLDREKSIRIEEPFARVIAGEGGYEGGLGRFGHGLQRSYLLALLQELASSDDTQNPRLILGCEEPELYQHPPQARHLSEVLQTLSRGNAQVIVATHHPVFVSGEGFEHVRLVRRDLGSKCSIVDHMSYAQVAARVASATGERPNRPMGVLAKIHQALQPSLSEMFFTPRLILVEGLEDVAFLTSYLHLLGRWDEYRRVGCHIVSTNGKSELIQPLAIATYLRIPTFVVFDADANKADRAGSRGKGERDNRAILHLVGASAVDPMPEATVGGKGWVMWHSDIRDIVRGDVGEELWARAEEHADQRYDQVGGLRKNALHIGAALEFAWSEGSHSANLDQLCDRLVDVSDSVAVEAEA